MFTGDWYCNTRIYIALVNRYGRGSVPVAHATGDADWDIKTVLYTTCQPGQTQTHLVLILSLDILMVMNRCCPSK